MKFSAFRHIFHGAVVRSKLQRTVREAFLRLMQVAQSERVFDEALRACEADEKDHRRFMARGGQRKYALSVSDTACYFLVKYVVQNPKPPTCWADSQIKPGALLGFVLGEILRARMPGEPVFVSEEWKAIEYSRDIVKGD